MADVASRGNRADEVRTERRRKPGSTTHYGLKLHVPEEKKDPAYVYRHVNDVGDRVEMMKENDWDVAPMDGQSVTSRHVGEAGAGTPSKAVLMRKRRDWYEDDQKEKRKQLDDIETAIKGGAGSQLAGEKDLAGVTYTPGSGNSISRD